jgi:hypothetical protein
MASTVMATLMVAVATVRASPPNPQ